MANRSLLKLRLIELDNKDFQRINYSLAASLNISSVCLQNKTKSKKIKKNKAF